MSSNQVPDRMQVDPPPTRQSRTSINYLLSPEQPPIVKPQSQRPQHQSQDLKFTKLPLQTKQCTNCGEWMSFIEGDDNETELWQAHQKKCSKASPAPSDASSSSFVEDTTPYRRYKTRVNEEERLTILRKDKQIEHIEEYQVLCAFCDSWVQLRKDRPYCSIAWNEHKLICRKRQPSRKPSPKPPSAAKRPKREHTASSVMPVPPSDNASTTRSTSLIPNSSTSSSLIPRHGSIPPPSLPSSLARTTTTTTPPANHHHPRRSDSGTGRAAAAAAKTSDAYAITSPPQIRRTESERVKLLVSDPNATTVEPHRVLCAVCGRWIQLRKNSTYCTAPWIQHVGKCVKRNGPNSARNARRHSAGRTQTPRQATPSVSRRASAEQQLADREELESDPDLEAEDLPHSSSRRPRGRPRKRRIGHSSFPPQQGQTTALGRRSISPIPVPSPPPSHPYPGHRYVYTSIPPVSSLFNYYAHSQHSTTDDSYAMYFEAEAIPASVLSQLTLPSFSPGEGKRWIVWQLQNYEKNDCPIVETVSSIPAGAVKASDSGGSGGSGESGERNPDSTQPGLDNVNAGDRVNTSSDLPSLRSGSWPHAVAAGEEGPGYQPQQSERPNREQQQQQQAVRRSLSLNPENGSFHDDHQQQQQQQQPHDVASPHRPAIPAYESPRLPREPYRSPHMDLLPAVPKSLPSVPPIHSPTPRRQSYYSGSEDETAVALFQKETKPYITPPPPPPPVHPHFSPSVAPSDSYTASSIHLPPPPSALPLPPPPLPSYPVSESYHASPHMPHLRERDYHSPRHPPLGNNSTFHPSPSLPFRQTPPPPWFRDEQPPPPPPPHPTLPPSQPPSQPSRYDTPGSSVHHSTPGMNYRSPNISRDGEEDDRRSSFQKSKRLRHTRSRSRSRSRNRSRSRSRSLRGMPHRPIPTSSARVSSEARLHYTHRCIAYLFQTSLKGAVDIPLMTVMTFMNDGFESHDARTSHFTFEEVRDYVAELGRRQMLIFTKEGGVQLGEI